MGVKMVTVRSVGLMPSQEERQLRKLSAPPDMQQVVIFVFCVLAQVALAAVGQTKDGELGDGPGLDTAAWSPFIENHGKPRVYGFGARSGCHLRTVFRGVLRIADGG